MASSPPSLADSELDLVAKQYRNHPRDLENACLRTISVPTPAARSLSQLLHDRQRRASLDIIDGFNDSVSYRCTVVNNIHITVHESPTDPIGRHSSAGPTPPMLSCRRSSSRLFEIWIQLTGQMISAMLTIPTNANSFSSSSAFLRYFTLRCVFVGFFSSLFGLLFNTTSDREETLPLFGYHHRSPPNVKRIMTGIASLATAYAFVAAMCNFLPHNYLIPWITAIFASVACTAFITSIFRRK